MKKRFLILTLVIACALFPSLMPTVSAQPSTAPSAVAAARLKHRPPKNWIRHYLGDDRYKIAGGVWKVVSTEMDRYYYPAWAPEMLGQKADIVIGFSSIAEAEEAGYAASAYPMGEALYGLTPAEIAAAQRRAASIRALGGTQITLSDGRSTVILPNGWKHTQIGSKSQATSAGAVNYQMDMLTSASGTGGGIIFAFINLPSNVNIAPFLSPARVDQLRAQLNQRAGSDASLAASLQGSKLGTGRLGGLTGLTIIPGEGAQMPAGMAGRITLVGRGSKMYMMAGALAATDRNYGIIVNSFQAR